MPHLCILDAAGVSQRRLLAKEKKRLEKQGYGHGGTLQEETAWADVMARGKTRGLFSEKTYLVVEKPESLGKFPTVVEPELEASEALSWIFLAYSKSWKEFFSPGARKNITLLKEDKKDILPLWGRAREEWIFRQTEGAGIVLSSEALAFLSDQLNSGEELRQELRKLQLVYQGKPLGIETVAPLCTGDGEKDLFRFLDGVCYGRIGQTLESFWNLKKREPFLRVLTALYNRVRPGMYMMLLSGAAQKDLLESIKAKPMQLRMGREMVRRYSREALCSLVISLAYLSAAEKAGTGPGWWGLEMAVLRFVAEKQ